MNMLKISCLCSKSQIILVSVAHSLSNILFTYKNLKAWNCLRHNLDLFKAIFSCKWQSVSFLILSSTLPLGWDSDLSSILLLVHLLPPTSKGHKKSAKISSYQAVKHVVSYLRVCMPLFWHCRFLCWGTFVFSSLVGHYLFIFPLMFFLQIGASLETFLAHLEPGQPFLLCVGEERNNIQRYYVIVEHKAIPCKGQTSLAAFDELFKAHFVFSGNYNESLNSFYTFMQTTVFNIEHRYKGKSES